MDEIEILLVEDNPGDARLTIEALKDIKVANKLHHVADGIEALDFLYQRSDYSDVSRPDLIFLDLNMPKMNGQEVLEIIKQDEGLKSIPVIILTTSQAEEDILSSYEHHANCFVTKPVDLDQFIKVLSAMNNFWLQIVKYP